jgi:excisionase family DNA binding protein
MRLLTASEVASILQVSKARIYELARTGAIPSIILGQRQVRFSEIALQEWLRQASSTLTNEKGAQA